jgi:hypothetical protein
VNSLPAFAPRQQNVFASVIGLVCAPQPHPWPLAEGELHTAAFKCLPSSKRNEEDLSDDQFPKPS